MSLSNDRMNDNDDKTLPTSIMMNLHRRSIKSFRVLRSTLNGNLKGKEITPEERKIIIKLRNEGKTLREIGKIVGRTHSSIQRVINNCTSSKSIISKRRSGRRSKLTACEKRHVFKSVSLKSTYKCLSDCK
ncbi:uncharacterized protein CEXT_360621 [Caerostris extrusa]|uniref:Transposase IS30-like HTH domain-containing protein n=1 Tax=Caerostris extrusa TaxID=172846 RepID=A0AAV4XGT9_CAEEX|nr:uncharacterized protein CEXT_360621 [Caerostris extrusa]